MSKPVQLTAADVHRLTRLGRPDEVERHRLAGRLDDILGIERAYPPDVGQWSADDFAAMNREGRFTEIEAARAAGHLADILDGTDPDAAA